MTFPYGKDSRADISATSTLEAIKKGERTATTRYDHIDHWKKFKAGDIVQLRGNYDNVLVKITTPLHKLTPDTNAEEWSKKEGWSVGYYNRVVKPRVDRGEAYQIEYELYSTQQLSDTQLQEATEIIQLRSPEAFASVSESQQTINSDKTILSNEELKYWNEKGVGDKPRILVGSEHSDPAFHVKEILDVLNGTRTVRGLVPINKEEWETLPASERRSSTKNGVARYYKLDTPVTGHDFAGLYLITKHDGLPMLDLLQTKIPKLIHFSITTLGGTEYEPGVMKYNDLLDRIEDYLKQGLDPESVTIRIDPIVPGVTDFNDVEEVVKRASTMGIKRIRFSVMDAYPETVREMTQRNYNFEE